MSKLTDKITGTSSHKLILAHMPLIMVCIEGLGKLAEKFPMLSKQSSDCLREFLTTPSPILSRLSRHYNRQEPKKNLNVPALTVTESSDSIKSIREYADTTYDKHSKSLRAFEKLRDCAIDNLRASPFLIQYIQEKIPDWNNAVIVAKNPLVAKRASSYAERLRLGIAFMHGEVKEEDDEEDGRASPPPQELAEESLVNR